VTPPAAARPGLADWLWCLAALAASAAWCLTAAGQLGPTYDETLYVRLGLERWRTGSYWAILREGTMPLPLDVQALPLHVVERLRGVPFDPVDQLDRVLPAARAATLVFWALLVGYGWRAAWDLGGPWAGRLAAPLLASEPNLLAHATLATTDVAVAACLLALAYHFERGRGRRWALRVGVPALWFAAAVLAKASGLVLGVVVLVVVEAVRARRIDRVARRDLAQIAGGGLAAAFLYCGSDWRPEPSLVAWAQGLDEGPLRSAMVWLADHLRVFRNAGDGLVRQVRHNLLGHQTFLLGQEYRRGVWYYFPVVLTIKLPLSLLALPVLVAWCRPRALVNWAVVLAGVLLLLSVTFRVQLGIRFLLPLVGIAIVGIAAAMAAAARGCARPWQRRLVVAAAVAAVAWQGAAAARVWPHGLTYANELWGGPAAAYRHVSDSNYDWGQGLRELERWRVAHGLAELAIWYFGTDPAIARLPLAPIGFEQGIVGGGDVAAAVGGRYLAVSTSLLYGRLWTDSQRRAAAYLRSRPPVDRTATYLIYDFRDLPPSPPEGGSGR
jgi:hypothetical protein